ncbi:hypothetical protein ACP4OV_004289 [Aristida adscensionis]
MQMADDPNLNFGAFSQALYNQHVVSFQTSATTSGSGGLPVYPDCSSGMDNNMGMLSTTPSVIVSTSSSNIPADSGPNLKYGGPLTGDWSLLELQLLKDGLEKYANERGIMKYIKIAATLPNKTVRDVAMRCQWLGKKVNTRRRKPEEHHSGRKIKERKDKFVEPALWGANHPVQADLRVPALLSHNAQNNLFLSGASEIDRAMEHLLQENNRLLNKIETNILTFQAQNNIDLFHQARTNINNLLQIMSRMPGMMSKMPTLRVTINENLASLVLPGLTMEQQQRLGSSHLKEEPRGW